MSDGDDRKLLAIGVGVPGVIDPLKGVALSYKHIVGWENVPIVERLARRFGVPVFVENTIRTMALAELWFGQGRGLRNFICLGLRSGLGAGIIIDGQVYRGANNRAGEIGDWPTMVSDGMGDPEARGHAARLEDLVSLQALQPRLGRARGARQTETLDALLQAARSGEPEVLAFLDRAAAAFSLVLTQLHTAFRPEKFILAGAFSVFGDLFMQRLQTRLQELQPLDGVPIVVNSLLGSFNGALGAAALAVHEWKPVPP